jgi:mannose-6-phosphate isomerase class I
MYLPAGVLHAYLEGSGMEIMANSNNVLRGGLTPKHVDVPELLSNVTFEGAPAEVLEAKAVPGKREWVYETPVEEFELRRLELAAGAPRQGRNDHSAEILIVLSSDGPVQTDGFSVKKGEAFFVPRGVSYTLSSKGPAVLYAAAAPALRPN